MRNDDDPGWAITWRALLWMLVPRVGLQRQIKRAKEGQADALLVLRQIFVSFCLMIAVLGVVLLVLYPGSEKPADAPTGVAIGLLVVGAATVVVGRLAERPLDCTDDETLASSYRVRFFLRVAFSNAVALIGFVGFFLTYAWWNYPIGAAIAAMGLRRAAPTSARLAANQEELATRGCGLSLVHALQQPPPLRT